METNAFRLGFLEVKSSKVIHQFNDTSADLSIELSNVLKHSLIEGLYVRINEWRSDASIMWWVHWRAFQSVQCQKPVSREKSLFTSVYLIIICIKWRNFIFLHLPKSYLGRSERSERSPISLPACPMQFVKNGKKKLLWRAKRAFEDGRWK